MLRLAFRIVLPLAAAGLVGSPGALGQPAPSAQARPSVKCTRGVGNALGELSCELASALEAVPSGALVVSGPLVADTKVESAQVLTARLASLVAGSLGKSAQSRPEPADLVHAQTLAGQASGLVYLAPQLTGGELRVVADAYQGRRKFWARVLGPKPNPTAHAFAARRIDAELRSFLPPVPLVARRVERAPSPEKSALALACADIDDDGALELVVAGRRQVLTGRLRGGRFLTLRSANWGALSPVARAPWRDPVGTIALRTEGLDVGISDRSETVHLDAALGVKARIGGRLPWPGSDECAELHELALAGPRPCVAEKGGGTSTAAGHDWDALAGARIVGRDGQVRWVRAARVAGEARVELSDSQGRRAEVTGAGAQLAVGDWNGDGDPDLVSSLPTLDAGADGVVLSTWTSDGRVLERFRMGVPKGVRALALCPAESAGPLPLVIAAGDELWIAR